MKRLLGKILFCSFMFLSACSQGDLNEDEVYLFYQTTCPHCHDAAKYIKGKYPDLKVTARDIKLPGNMRLFEQALQKYDIKGAAGTPLILLGEHYIMGWSSQDETLFDVYVKPFLE